MDTETNYRNVTSAVRTPRNAILIDISDKYWKSYVRGIIHSFSRVWGGQHFVIIPTDGETIDESFWRILEQYSPDKIGRYIPSLLDLKDAARKQYEKLRTHYKKVWNLKKAEFKRIWNEQLRDSHISGMKITQELSEELKNRLSPFYFQDHIVGENVFNDSNLGYPFTNIVDIVEHAKDRPTKVTIPRGFGFKDYDLLEVAHTGAISESFIEELAEVGVTSVKLSERSQYFNDRNYIESLLKGEYDGDLSRKLVDIDDEANDVLPEDDFVQSFPFRLTKLHLGDYYRTDTHRDFEENIQIIVGNTVSDYCLFYGLSRLHEKVFWLPEASLRKAYRKHILNRKRSENEEVVKYTRYEQLAASMVNEYHSLIGYGHGSKKIEITSHSLSVRQLETRRKWMGELATIEKVEFTRNIIVLPIKDTPRNCVMRVLERNNFANQQDMIFQNNKSVGRVNTPKPKHFNFIDASKHRWITSLEVDGYHPPVLPFLGAQIVQIRNMDNETRVAQDGLAYLCPNIAFWNGNDIDTTTVRPMLNLINVQEIFTQYFAYSGLNIELSDKGSYLIDTIDRFGSLENVADFFESAVNRDIFDQFLVKKVGDPEVIYIEVEKRAYLSFEAVNRKLPSVTDAEAMVEDLMKRSVIYRGYVFHCSRCRLSAWYDIKDVGNEFSCKRCDLKQPYTKKNWKSPSEPRWYYRLAETVYLFYESSSHLTSLALNVLQKEAKNGFMYIGETDIKSPDGKIENRELDLLAISNGEIVLGEAKDTTPKPADMSKYRPLIALLHIKPSYFLLATTKSNISADSKTELDFLGRSRVFTKMDIYKG